MSTIAADALGGLSSDVSAHHATYCQHRADQHAVRLALLNSLQWSPEAVHDRETMWMELHRLELKCRHMLDRIRDALEALDMDDGFELDFSSVFYNVANRGQGSEPVMRGHAKLFAYLGDDESQPKTTDRVRWARRWAEKDDERRRINREKARARREARRRQS